MDAQTEIIKVQYQMLTLIGIELDCLLMPGLPVESKVRIMQNVRKQITDTLIKVDRFYETQNT